MMIAILEKSIEIVCKDDNLPSEAIQLSFTNGCLPLIKDNKYTLLGFIYYDTTHKFAALLEEYNDAKITWDIKWFTFNDKSLYNIIQNSNLNYLREVYLSKNN